MFDVVETIRQTAVKFRREDDSEAVADAGQEAAIAVARADGERRARVQLFLASREYRRRPASQPPPPDSRARRFHPAARHDGLCARTAEGEPERDSQRTATLQKFFNDALIVPVLTAHPTEVQRKSILDAQHEVARLLAERDQELTARERAHNEAMLRARVTSLWQTRMLRDARLTVADEIENALSYYRATFLEEIPALYADIEAALRRARPAPRACRRSCRWAAGLAAIATAIRTSPRPRSMHAITRQATVIFEHYLEQVHKLGAELSVSNLLAGASDALKALADASPDQSPHRIDEPYRRALIGMYTRLAASAACGSAKAACRCAARAARHPAKPYAIGGGIRARPARADRIARRASRRVSVGAASVAAGARRRSVRLPSGEHRLASKLGHPRSGDRGTAQARGRRRTITRRCPKPTRSRCC